MAVEPLHVVEHRADDPDAPVIVLVHGVLDSSASFEGVVDELVPEFTVVTYDRRGWGRSRDASPAAVPRRARRTTCIVGDGGAAGHGRRPQLRRRGRPARRRSGGPISSPRSAVFEPSMQWADVVARPWRRSPSRPSDEQEHFRAGLEDRPRPTPEERARDQALLAHELTLIREPPFDVRRRHRAVSRGARRAHDAVARRVDRPPAPTSSPADLVVIEDAGHTAHRTQPKAFADFARRPSRSGRRRADARRRAPAGDPDAPVIVLVHGLLDSARELRRRGRRARRPSSRSSPTTGAGGAVHATTSRRSRWPTTRTTRWR